MTKDAVLKIIKEYRFVLWILLAGILLLWASSFTRDSSETQPESSSFSLAETQTQMEEILGKIDGAGRVSVMLTLKSSSRLTLAQDTQDNTQEDQNRRERTTIKLNRGSGTQEVVVTEEVYPEYMGAVVVCDGAANSAVRLEIIQTVGVLTGLGSDKISIVQWKS